MPALRPGARSPQRGYINPQALCSDPRPLPHETFGTHSRFSRQERDNSTARAEPADRADDVVRLEPPYTTLLNVLGATYQRAVDAGAEVIETPSDQFYGDRRAMVQDGYGNVYQIATRIHS